MKPVILCFLLFYAFNSFAQPAILWQKAYGSTAGHETSNRILQTNDGGYIIMGTSTAGGDDVTGHHNAGIGHDVWVVKLDANGAISWAKCYGGTGVDMGQWIEQTAGNGYIFCGYTESNDGDVSGNHGNPLGDAWVVKIDDTGKIEWQKCLGGTDAEIGTCIKPTGDGYIMVANAASTDGDVSGVKGQDDLWVVKLDATGGIQWQKCFGGNGYDISTTILQAKDGNYIISGYTNSIDGDVVNPKGGTDGWIIKLSNTGTLIWQKTYGGSGNDYLYNVEELPSSSGFVFSGETTSTNGDISGNKGSNDAWVLKIDNSGAIQWSKTYGGSQYDQARHIVVGTDTSYIIACLSSSTDGDISGTHGITDGWLLSLKQNGDINWQKAVGGSKSDDLYAIAKTAGGGLVTAGTTRSTDGDATNSGFHGSTQTDIWVIKFDVYAVGIDDEQNNYNEIMVYPTVSAGDFYVKLPATYSTATVEMTDMYGRNIPLTHQQQGSNIRVSPGDIPPANYLLKVICGAHVHTVRVVYQP